MIKSFCSHFWPPFPSSWGEISFEKLEIEHKSTKKCKNLSYLAASLILGPFIKYGVGMKVSAILGISFGIGPKPKKWFQSYTTWCLAFPKYTLHTAHWCILYIISIHLLLFIDKLLNLLGNLQIHQKPLKYSVPKEKAPNCEKGTGDNVFSG